MFAKRPVPETSERPLRKHDIHSGAFCPRQSNTSITGRDQGVLICRSWGRNKGRQATACCKRARSGIVSQLGGKLSLRDDASPNRELNNPKRVCSI